MYIILCDYCKIVQLESCPHIHKHTKNSFFSPFYSHKRSVLYKTKNRKCIENFSKGPFRIFSVTQQQKDMFDARFDIKPRTMPFWYVYFLSQLCISILQPRKGLSESDNLNKKKKYINLQQSESIEKWQIKCKKGLRYLFFGWSFFQGSNTKYILVVHFDRNNFIFVYLFLSLLSFSI